ncbi:MAG: sigma-70 family RNA polymerase sigma factor [Planctomycetes bacterium]|nr:sigma-70 family RNA polymerase sigma factor [Planctomycetota bacterium]
MPSSREESHEFEEAMLPHLDAVYRFAVYLTGNEPDAEDLVQETYHHAMRRFDRFQPGTNARAWLFTIARNCRIDRARRESRESHFADIADLEETLDLEDRKASPEARLEDWASLSIDGEDVFFDLFGDEVNRFLAELPSGFRAALLLCDVEGLSYREIGEALGCPVGTVRSRIARAREHLRVKLYEYAKGLGFVKHGAG